MKEMVSGGIRPTASAWRILLQASASAEGASGTEQDGTQRLSRMAVLKHGEVRPRSFLAPGVLSPQALGSETPLSPCKWEWMTDPGSGREEATVWVGGEVSFSPRHAQSCPILVTP